MNDWILRGKQSMTRGAAPALTMSPEQAELRALEAKINALLPPQYQYCYDAVAPTSMGSAGLKYGRDGKVAWDEIWTSFCDLALAGGPPHRGTLLPPVSAEEARSDPQRYQQVVAEIARGVWLVSQLPVLPHVAPGWVGVVCANEAMAAWLLRAVVTENVSARRERHVLHLPAGPQFQLAREIKNVVTVVAKTCHYWSCHMDAGQQAAAPAGALPGPALPCEIAANPPGYQAAVAAFAAGIRTATGLDVHTATYPGWIGVPCADVATAVWLLRAVLASDVLARREEHVLYLPVQPALAPGEQVTAALASAVRLHQVHRNRASAAN